MFFSAFQTAPFLGGCLRSTERVRGDCGNRLAKLAQLVTWDAYPTSPADRLFGPPADGSVERMGSRIPVSSEVSPAILH